jgi:hypothetical protein
MRVAPAAKYAFPVTFMCRILTVSTSGYYEWRARPESATAHALAGLVEDLAAGGSPQAQGERQPDEQRHGTECAPQRRARSRAARGQTDRDRH